MSDARIAPRGAGRRVAFGPLVLLLIAAVLLGPGSSSGQTADSVRADGHGRIESPQGTFRSLQTAIEAARPGDTLLVYGGRHPGPIRIDRRLALLGRSRPHLAGAGDSTVVTVEAPGVTVRGFLITASGDNLREEDAGISVNASGARIVDNRISDVLFGIYLRRADDSVLRGNLVRGMPTLGLERRGDLIRAWYSDRIRVEDNSLVDGRDTILWFSDRALIRGNTIRRSRYGLHFMYSDSARVVQNQMRRNSVGAYLMYSRALTVSRNLLAHNRTGSAMGLGLKDVDDGRITGNVLVDNEVGLFVDNSPRSSGARMRYRANAVVYNDLGIKTLSYPSRTHVLENTISGNYLQLQIAGGRTPPADRSDEWRGNYWSDYRGYDLDEDGRGDRPYRARHVFGRLLDRYPRLRLFAYGPSVQAVELAAQAFPVLQPQVWITDAAPRMSPPDPPASPGATEGGNAPMGAGAAACLAAGGLILAWGTRSRFARIEIPA